MKMRRRIILVSPVIKTFMNVLNFSKRMILLILFDSLSSKSDNLKRRSPVPVQMLKISIPMSSSFRAVFVKDNVVRDRDHVSKGNVVRNKDNFVKDKDLVLRDSVVRDRDHVSKGNVVRDKDLVLRDNVVRNNVVRNKDNFVKDKDLVLRNKNQFVKALAPFVKNPFNSPSSQRSPSSLQTQKFENGGRPIREE
jgi:hypothetical protein